MPSKVIETPYPLIDSDPHASRVIRYMRPSDYAVWAASTGAFPAALYAWSPYCLRAPDMQMLNSPTDLADPFKAALRTSLRLGGFLGFFGGFLLSYQRSSARFWGWSENKREEEMDLAELSQRASEGKSLYGESPQPHWVQAAAARNSQFSQLKFAAFPMLNLVNHPHHGTDPAKYGVKSTEESN
ncbi:hypothetical protein C0993_005789 [Termitomyces sp. T159_Od127]|nr:hypothetical protein C0993_005789 [Termitomyces sp. T159_Od127]